MKKIFVLLVIVILLFTFSINCVAISDTVINDENYVYGYYSKDIHWNIIKRIRVLRILGDGKYEYAHHIEAYFDLFDTLEIKSGIEEIGESAFEDYQFSTLVLEDGIKRIDDNAFKNCKNLKKLVIPKTVEYIGKFAFDGCTSLEDVYIYSSNLVVDEGAFDNCENIKFFKCYGNEPQFTNENDKLILQEKSNYIIPIIFSISISLVIVLLIIIFKRRQRRCQ